MKFYSNPHKIHESHHMNEWYCDVRALNSTERFYDVRECVECSGEEIRANGGHYVDNELLKECEWEGICSYN